MAAGQGWFGRLGWFVLGVDRYCRWAEAYGGAEHPPRQVGTFGSPLNPGLGDKMGRLVDVQEEPVMPRSRRPDLLGGTLTNRELQVLAYQKTCLSGSDISRELGISPRRLQRHIWAITLKLSTGHRRDATRAARDARPDDSCWPFW